MDDQEENTSFMGETEVLPSALNLIKFTAARSREIQAMRDSLSTFSGTKLAFQKLPKHMRRRVMSHNAKRLPRRLREIHTNQLKKSGMPPKQKRPSRKYRRRARNLLSEYERRRRKIKWLETHIWHAKRFKMVEKWGYKLPYCPCDKAFRACYRAAARHCLLEDLSYFGCIELNGPEEIVTEKLKGLCSDSYLSIAAKVYKTGRREGETIFFKPDTGTKRTIGTVYFIWKPPISEEKRSIWIWVHPAYFEEVLDTLIDIFNLSQTNMETDFIKTIPSFINSKTSITLLDLRQKLNRFRLTGPLSTAILQDSLKIIEPTVESDWFQKYLEDDRNRQSYVNQRDLWTVLKSLQSPASLSPHLVISLVVVDPRFYIPKKRTKAVLDDQCGKQQFYDIADDISITPLWNENVRNTVTSNKMSNAEIATQRSQLLVPGTDMESGHVPVPIILIQRPGTKTNLGKYLH